MIGRIKARVPGGAVAGMPRGGLRTGARSGRTIARPLNKADFGDAA